MGSVRPVVTVALTLVGCEVGVAIDEEDEPTFVNADENKASFTGTSLVTVFPLSDTEAGLKLTYVGTVVFTISNVDDARLQSTITDTTYLSPPRFITFPAPVPPNITAIPVPA